MNILTGTVATDIDVHYKDLCQTCNGTGEGMVDGSYCHACKGKGIARDYEAEAEKEAEAADHWNDALKLGEKE
jgi:DnaJ-class molecular chaperone